MKARFPPAQAALAAGTVHGVAGTAHVLGVLPAIALPSWASSGVYLGAFALGVFTTRTTTKGLLTGMAISLGSMWMVWFNTKLAWTWYVLVGTVICVTVGYVVSLLVPHGNWESRIEN